NAPFVDRSRTTAGNFEPIELRSASTRRNTFARFGCSCIEPWPIDSTTAGALTTRRGARRMSDIDVLLYSRSRRDVVVDGGKSEDLLLAGGEDHAVGHQARELLRR